MGQPNPFRDLEEVYNRTFVPESQRQPSGEEPRRDNNILGGIFQSAGRFLKRNAFAIAAHTASFLYQDRQRRKLKRSINALAERGRGIEIRFTAASGEVGVSYGYTASVGLPFYAQASKSLPSVPGTYGTLTASPGESRYNEFLMVQYVTTAAGISRILDIHVNGDPWESQGVSELVSHELTQNVASAHATAFTDERDTNSIANGFAVITGFYKYDQDDPLIYGIPQILTIQEGEEVRALTAAGFGDASFSNNAALCFADYLTNSIYGPKIPDDRIDHEIWAMSVERAEVPAPVSGVSDFHGVSIPKFRRYEVNGELNSPGNWLDSVSAFGTAMPGSYFWRRLNGKWALVLPETSNRTNEQRTEGRVITEADLFEPPTISFPNTNTRQNGQTTEFSNMFTDFSSDAETFRNSDFEKQDGGILLETTIGAELCATPHHATFINVVGTKTSRRPTYQLRGRPHMLVYEPADISKLHVPHYGVNNHLIQVQDMTLDVANNNGDLVVNITAIQYDRDDYEYTRGDVPTMQGVPTYNYRPGGVSSALLELLPNKVRELSTTWDIETADNNTEEFIIELAEQMNETDPIPESAWQRIGIVPEGQVRQFPHAIKDLPRCYTARVIPVSSNGVKGKPVRTNTVAVGDSRIDNLTCLDRPNMTLNNTWQSISDKLPPNWQTSFDLINMGLGVAGAKLPTFNVPIRPDAIASAIFTPTEQTTPDFTTPSGTKGFLYQAGGQIFTRLLQQVQQSPQEDGRQGPPGLGQGIPGFTEAISLGEIRGEVCPLPEDTTPALPRRALQLPAQPVINYFKGDAVDVKLNPATGGVLPYVYELENASALPSWLTFDPNTLRVFGTAQETGTFTAVLCVTDSA